MSNLPPYVGLTNVNRSGAENQRIPAMTTRSSHFLSKMEAWSKESNWWPFPFGSACCSLEYSAINYLQSELSLPILDFDHTVPEESDLLVVGGIVTQKLMPYLVDVYRRMPEHKWVVAIGSCACSGGGYRTYSMVQGISRDIPVDVYVPGCPPTPEAICQGIRMLAQKVGVQREPLQNERVQ